MWSFDAKPIEKTEPVEDHSWVTDEMWNEALADLIRDHVNTLLSIPGVYEPISEHFNNEALELVCERHDPDGIMRAGKGEVKEEEEP